MDLWRGKDLPGGKERINPQKCSPYFARYQEALAAQEKESEEFEKEMLALIGLKGMPLSIEQWREIRDGLPVRQASAHEYAAWARGFFAAGGKITHHYNDDMPRDFVVATASFDLPELGGALAVNVIVPPGLHVEPNGQCHVFAIDGYTASDNDYVPMYKDVAAII